MCIRDRVGRGLINVKNMKKYGMMGANAPNMLETQSDVFSKTLSALSSSTAVAMTLFGMYMAAFLPIGGFGQMMIGLFGFTMAGTLFYAVSYTHLCVGLQPIKDQIRACRKSQERSHGFRN